MSIVGKIKIADLLSLDRLIPKIGVRFCLGNLVFIGLDDPEFSLSLFFFFLSSLWFTQDSPLNLPSLFLDYIRERGCGQLHVLCFPCEAICPPQLQDQLSQT